MSARRSPHFKVLARLGMGGMGDVHLAQMQDARGERLVALKRIRADRRSDPELVASFQREARISSLLHHPRVVRLEAWGEDEDGFFLATEYVDGRSAAELSRRLHARREQLPLEAAWVILLDVAAGLAHAHGFGGEIGAVVHRDVAADNVLVSYEGDAKLADFGIAKISGSTTHTVTGTIKGKCAYMAPEVLRGGEATPCSDVYAFGILAHRLLTGSMPFRGGTDAEIIQAALFASPPKLRTLRPDLPEPLATLLDACVSKIPADRPASAQTLLEAFSRGDEAITYRTSLARVMERLFPRDGDELRTEISRAIEVRRTDTVSLRPKRAPHTARRWIFAALALVGLSSIGAALGWPALRSTTEERPVAAALAEPTLDAPVRQAPAGPIAEHDAQAIDAPSDEGDAQADDERDAHVLEHRTGEPVLLVAADPAPVPVKSEPAVKRTVKRTRTKTRAASGKVARVSAEPAYIQVLVYPWAQVFIDGALVGVSPPLPAQKVTPGLHSIILVNPELNVRRTYKVDAKAGKVSPLKVVLGK